MLLPGAALALAGLQKEVLLDVFGLGIGPKWCRSAENE